MAHAVISTECPLPVALRNRHGRIPYIDDLDRWIEGHKGKTNGDQLWGEGLKQVPFIRGAESGGSSAFDKPAQLRTRDDAGKGISL
jgi:hypothetical protein